MTYRGFMIFQKKLPTPTRHGLTCR